MNIIALFLKHLGVKYTNAYTESLYTEHPHKDNMYGLSDILRHYNVNTVGIKSTSKNIDKMEVPFIAHFGSDFVIVKHIDSNNVNYIWRGTSLEIPSAEFVNLWTGYALLPELSVESIEENYRTHKLNELKVKAFQYGLLLLSIWLLLFGISENKVLKSIFPSLSFGITIIGIYISYLLLQKQVLPHNAMADKICSILHQGDCNNVLKSKGALFLDTFTWSEIGLSFFITHCIIFSFFECLYPFMCLVNICALSYTFWSVWYQYKIAKQWCALCLCIQFLLCINGIIGLLYLQSISWNIIDFFSIHTFIHVFPLYMTPLLTISILCKVYKKAIDGQNMKQKFNSLKSNEDIFIQLLHKQPLYKVSLTDSSLIWGNHSSKFVITILSNPYCQPCSRMHKKVELLLTKCRNKVCIQYILSAFNDELKETNRFLIAAYQHLEPTISEAVFGEWFEKGKDHSDSFIRSFNYDLNTSEIDLEIERHGDWKTNSLITATPTILINGYLLPPMYQLEDLIYLIDFIELDI